MSWFGGAATGNAAPAASSVTKPGVKQKVFYIGVWKAQKPAHELARVRDLSFLNYFESKV